MNALRKRVGIVAIVAAAVFISVAAVGQQSVRQLSQPDQFSIGGYPYYGATATPNDSADLAQPGFIRADEAGAVTAACRGNGVGNQITLNLVAGEFFPCLVVRLYDTGTDAITLHVFY